MDLPRLCRRLLPSVAEPEEAQLEEAQLDLQQNPVGNPRLYGYWMNVHVTH